MSPEPASLTTATEEAEEVAELRERVARLTAVIATAHTQAAGFRLVYEATPGAVAEAAGASFGLVLATLEREREAA